MNKLEKLPVLYSFGFLKEFNGLVGGYKRNIFQFKIHHAFARFVKTNKEDILEHSGCGESFKKDFPLLLSEHILFGDFSSFPGVNGDESIYINFVVPAPETVSTKDYLLKQICDLGMLFSFLYVGSYLFVETEKGIDYRRCTIDDQPFIPCFIAQKSGYSFSFQIEGDLFRKMNHLLFSANENTNNEVKEAINSIIALYDASLQEYTRVVLRQKYVEIQLYGQHCCLITDYSGQYDYTKTLVLASKHVDSPVQLVALLAAVGSLFHLAETRK